MTRIRKRSGPRHFDGGRPDIKHPVTKLGKSAVKQRTPARHEALAAVGPTTLALPGGGYLEGDDRALDWLSGNGLIGLLPPSRPGGARPVERTAEGERVLAVWNERG